MENNFYSIIAKETKKPVLERPKRLFRFIMYILVCMSTLSAAAQNKYGGKIYEAYINGDTGLWNDVIQTMEASSLNNIEEKLELIEYYYGHTGYLIGEGKKETAREYIKKAEKIINEILAEDPQNATALAFKGTFTGYTMSLNKLKAPVLGPRTMKYIKQAYETDPENIQALSDMGNMLYYAPALFGGDKKEGMRYMERAINKMETMNMDNDNWYYLNLLVILAQYRQETGNPQEALRLYEKALSVEPHFKWVRDELYPNLKDKNTAS